jgi:hypothetical protein
MFVKGDSMKVSFKVNHNVAMHLQPETELEELLIKQMAEKAEKGIVFTIKPIKPMSSRGDIDFEYYTVESMVNQNISQTISSANRGVS